MILKSCFDYSFESGVDSFLASFSWKRKGTQLY